MLDTGSRIRVLRDLDAVRKLKPSQKRGGVEVRVEIDPFAAIPGPWLAAVCFLDPGSQKRLFQWV